MSQFFIWSKVPVSQFFIWSKVPVSQLFIWSKVPVWLAYNFRKKLLNNLLKYNVILKEGAQYKCQQPLLFVHLKMYEPWVSSS